MDFAKQHLNRPESFWENVVFSDESKFNIYGSDGAQKVWKKVNGTKYVMRTITKTICMGNQNQVRFTNAIDKRRPHDKK